MNRLKNNVLKVVLMALLSLVTVINCGKKDDKEGSGGGTPGGTPEKEKIDAKIEKGSDGEIKITFTKPNKKDEISSCLFIAKVGNSNVRLNLNAGNYMKVGGGDGANSASFKVKSVSDTEVIILVNTHGTADDAVDSFKGADAQRNKVKNMKVIGAGYKDSDEVAGPL